MTDPKKTAPASASASKAKTRVKAAPKTEKAAEVKAVQMELPEAKASPVKATADMKVAKAPAVVEPARAVQAAAKPDPIAAAVARVAAPSPKVSAAVTPPTVLPAPDLVAPATRLMEIGAEQAREAYARAQATTASLREAMAETASATTRGALEVNGKVIDAWRAQSDAALDLLHSTLRATSLSDAIRLQTSGARQVYETAATHWKDVAESTTRWFGAAVKPMQLALTPKS
jgi:hypothetical protein